MHEAIDIHEIHKRDFCHIIKMLMPMLKNYNATVLKLFEYSDGESPSDVDIFVSSEDLLKFIRMLAGSYGATFIKKPRFLTSSLEAVIKDFPNTLHLDLYYEFVFTPSAILTKLDPAWRTNMRISWCEEDAPSLERALDAFFILWHSLRHRCLAMRDIRTVVNRFNTFSPRDIIRFVALVEWSKMEVEYLSMLYIILLVLLNTDHIYKSRAEKDVYNAPKSIMLLIKVIEARSSKRLPDFMLKLIYRCFLKGKDSGSFKLYHLTNYKHFKDLSRISSLKSLYYYLRFLFVHFMREYLILVLLKLKILR